jgi:hypothetical protein
MSAQHISAFDLLQVDAAIQCSDCRKRLTDSPDHETWTRWNGAYFCPQCSLAEGIEATSAERESMERAQADD